MGVGNDIFIWWLERTSLLWVMQAAWVQQGKTSQAEDQHLQRPWGWAMLPMGGPARRQGWMGRANEEIDEVRWVNVKSRAHIRSVDLPKVSAFTWSDTIKGLWAKKECDRMHAAGVLLWHICPQYLAKKLLRWKTMEATVVLRGKLMGRASEKPQ